MSVGSITYQGTSLPFLAARFPAGYFDDEPIAQAEELITPGIDGRRWRTLFKQFPSFQMTTTHDATEYATAALTKQRAERLVQKLVTLQVTIGTVSYSMRQVHVSGVAAQLFPGPLCGAGTGSGTAHVDITWQLELTDIDGAAGA
jgi:hypothetical protein